MSKRVLPRVQAMVVCDALKEVEDESDVFHLHGVRNVLDVPSFPALRPRIGVLAHLSGHPGRAVIRLVINRLGTDEIIYEASPRDVAFLGPTSVVAVAFRARNCVFPMPGVYYIQLFHETKLIGERPLEVREER